MSSTTSSYNSSSSSDDSNVFSTPPSPSSPLSNITVDHKLHKKILRQKIESKLTPDDIAAISKVVKAYNNGESCVDLHSYYFYNSHITWFEFTKYLRVYYKIKLVLDKDEEGYRKYACVKFHN